MSKSRNKVHETVSGVALYRYVVFLGNFLRFLVNISYHLFYRSKVGRKVSRHEVAAFGNCSNFGIKTASAIILLHCPHRARLKQYFCKMKLHIPCFFTEQAAPQKSNVILKLPP